MKKICTMCQIEKDISLFYKDSRKSSWFRNWCKECFWKRYKYKHSKLKNETWKKYARSDKWTITLLLNNAKDRAKKNNLVFDLDREWVQERLNKWVCELSNIPFERNIEIQYRSNPFWPSIDKIIPSQWYTKDNSRLICFCVNMARSDWWDENLFKMCSAIISNKKD